MVTGKGAFYLYWPVLLLALGVYGCNQPYGAQKPDRCQECHRVRIDRAHKLPCTDCHRGNSHSLRKKKAHKGLVAHPASYENAQFFCKPCHASEVESAYNSIHWTLKGEIAAIWSVFYPDSTVPSVKDLHGFDEPQNEKELLLDLMARRCVKCHVYSSGEGFSSVSRGMGCAACHLGQDRRLMHLFKIPGEKECLSCHRSNFTGWDFGGRFEKDYPSDFRAPLVKGRSDKREYGLEWINMAKDVHKKNYMTCMDCQTSFSFHPDEKAAPVKCRDCHQGQTRSCSQKTGKERISCTACHAVWGFYDFGRDLLRIDMPDLEDWEFIITQGSSELEALKETMTDKIHNEEIKGVWIEGFSKRRWWPVVLGRSEKGEISVIRPILDLRISYVDENEELPFDVLLPVKDSGWSPIYPAEFPFLNNKRRIWLPYTPHTVGKPDIFRTLFIKRLIQEAEDAEKGGAKTQPPSGP